MSNLKFVASINKGGHDIESENCMVCADTGRVIAVFYNDYDLLSVESMQDEIATLKAERDELIGQVKKCRGSLLALNARHRQDTEYVEAVENAYLFECKESINIVKSAPISTRHGLLMLNRQDLVEYANKLTNNAGD